MSDEAARHPCTVVTGATGKLGRVLVEALLAGEVLDAVDWQLVHAALVEAIKGPEDAHRSTRYRRKVAANALVHGLSGRFPGRQVSRSQQALAPADHLPDEIRLGRAGTMVAQRMDPTMTDEPRSTDAEPAPPAPGCSRPRARPSA